MICKNLPKEVNIKNKIAIFAKSLMVLLLLFCSIVSIIILEELLILTNMLLSIIDWFNNFIEITHDKIIEFLRSWGVPPEKEQFYVICLIVLIIVFFIIFRIWPFFEKWLNHKRKIKKWRKDLIEKRLGVHYPSYTYTDQEEKKQNETIGIEEKINNKLFYIKQIWSHIIGKDNRNIYIETRAQNIPPDDNEDPEDSIRKVVSENLMNKYLKDILVKENTGKNLYYVIAGSGMGKTTFAVNLLKQYINKYTDETKPYDIYLFNIGNKKTFNLINEIDKEIQRKSILILDALDENTEAVNYYEEFIHVLEELIKDFRIVIITCRTQFFDDKDSEPKVSSLYYRDSKDGAIKYKKCINHYISVFNDEEIEKYIKQKYYDKRKRKKAKEIIEKCKSLMLRPLLLSYIDDLIDEKDADLSKTINNYNILIDKWLDREVKFWKIRKNKNIISDDLKDELYRFSNDLAVEIYNNQNKNGGLFLSKAQVDKFVEDHNYLDYNYRGRSLVNRYASGNIKFAHKSFLEYFLAKQMFERKIHISFMGMDMAETFYKELCEIEMERLIREGSINYYQSERYGKCIIIHKAIEFYSIPGNEYFFLDSIIFLSWDAITDTLYSWFKALKDIQLVIFNYHITNHDLDILKKILLESMNWSKMSLIILSDNTIRRDDIIWKDLKQLASKWPLFEFIKVEEEKRITPEYIELTLRYIKDRISFKSLLQQWPNHDNIDSLMQKLVDILRYGIDSLFIVRPCVCISYGNGKQHFLYLKRQDNSLNEEFVVEEDIQASNHIYLPTNKNNSFINNGYLVINNTNDFFVDYNNEGFIIKYNFKSVFMYYLGGHVNDTVVSSRFLCFFCRNKNEFNQSKIKFFLDFLGSTRDDLNTIIKYTPWKSYRNGVM